MSHVQVQDKMNRTDHSPGFPNKSTIVMTRQVLIGAYGCFATIRVEFDVDNIPAINKFRCEELQRRMVDMALTIADAATLPQQAHA